MINDNCYIMPDSFCDDCGQCGDSYENNFYPSSFCIDHADCERCGKKFCADIDDYSICPDCREVTE